MPRDVYGRLLETMLYFHGNFRRTHALLAATIPRSQTLPRRELEALLQRGLGLAHHLEMHHSIEEAHIFPRLAVRMPAFAQGDAHIKEHAAMHARLEVFEAYCSEVLNRLKTARARKAEQDGAGQPIKTKAGQEEEDEEEDEDDQVKRGPWPTDIYDKDRMEQLTKDLASTLFPHLDAEERSLRADNLRKAGFTEREMMMIPL
ncbi:hypothetical protein FA10DRAFT_166516 [Acaromyces ingoldii]|uniref:Hemerythrin-like domain-containing protein n=1 Tax=Acaromyces ingoldii TaxID=215250 RepID=A0A316YGL9_9BASI|nr:hypothetical protein FA10DRAFT_166516 [Acaromyces ingoldii]PWN88567.1 hypothetical protein FA10DRAFT_166516 [Acaromyces ingoldii]